MWSSFLRSLLLSRLSPPVILFNFPFHHALRIICSTPPPFSRTSTIGWNLPPEGRAAACVHLRAASFCKWSSIIKKRVLRTISSSPVSIRFLYARPLMLFEVLWSLCTLCMRLRLFIPSFLPVLCGRELGLGATFLTAGNSLLSS